MDEAQTGNPGAIPGGEKAEIHTGSGQPRREKERGTRGTPHLSSSTPVPPFDERNPTGAQMLARGYQVKLNLYSHLPSYPPGRGSHALNYLYYLKRFCWRSVRVQTTPTITLTYASFEAFRHTPTYESVRRRTQEIQHDERERIWLLVAEKLAYPDFKDKAWRKTNEAAKAAFNELAKTSVYLPTKRTREKRGRFENAQTHYYSDRQMAVSDFTRGEEP
jgi:hypothetical protein